MGQNVEYGGTDSLGTPPQPYTSRAPSFGQKRYVMLRFAELQPKDAYLRDGELCKIILTTPKQREAENSCDDVDAIMDFWSRLLSHTPLSASSSKKEIAKDPLRRRHRFEREYGQLLQTWRNSSNLVTDAAAADTIELRIHELTDILRDESHRPLPHTCLSYAAEKQIYVYIGKIASTSYNLLIIKEAIFLFGMLIESEDDAFVESHAFASSLTNLLVRVTGANSIRLDPEAETKVVELAFNITTKIRLRPEILSAWFREHQSRQPQQHPQKRNDPHRGAGGSTTSDGNGDSAREKQSEDHKRFRGKTQRQDFPLFYILMDYIHSEGKVGDFARTGLLYIVESASAARSVSLEQWIVESDLSTLMATGLGALYSQLSRKLVIDHPANNLPPILALSDYQHPRPAFEVVNSCSPEFQVQLDTFLSHLLFWQDVLNHCRSVEVKSTLLEHFQVIFLQQLLYPSLLESSDIDGGSSVAVLTYLRRILESLDHPDMINLILHYLLALPEAADAVSSADQGAVAAARKRKSMDLATMMASKPEVAATPLLFNLVDLLLACLKSQNPHTINATLQLVSVILRRHHRYAVMTLVRTAPVSGNSTRRTIGAHYQEIEFFMVNAGVVGGQDNVDEVYKNVLTDVVGRLESHPCSYKLTAPKVSSKENELPTNSTRLPGAPHDVCLHTIQPDEPLLTAIVDRLETFFVNPVDTNLLITETVLDLATCGYTFLEGWLLRHPDFYAFPGDESGNIPVLPKYPASLSESNTLENDFSGTDQQLVRSMQRCRLRPQWTNLPRILVVLQDLSDQVVAYRQSIPRFADLIQQRREAFRTADSVSSSPAYFKGSPNSVSGAANTDHSTFDHFQSTSSARSSGLEGFAQRLLFELGTPSRSASPWAKKETGRGFFSPNNTGSGGGSSGGKTQPSGYSLAMSMSTKLNASASEDSTLYASTSNTSSKDSGMAARPRSPDSHLGEVASWDDRDNPVASQTAAFQAIDRQILARRVGIPMKTTPEPQPLYDEHSQLKTPVGGGGTGQGVDSDAKRSAVPSENGIAISPTEEQTVTVSHILTNTVVLQHFLLELAAVLQARAGYFGEVLFA